MVKKTRRGIFINLADSDIVFTHNGTTYKFSSNKKREIFLKRVNESINALNKLNGKIFKYTSKNKDYNIDDLINGVYDKVYNNMLYK